VSEYYLVLVFLDLFRLWRYVWSVVAVRVH
jgi:hypothetical protein